MNKFLCFINAILIGLGPSILARENTEDEIQRAFTKLAREELEISADWPQLSLSDDRFTKIYDACVAPAKPSEFCRGFLALLGKDAVTAALLSALVRRLTPEECARLALSSLRWASARMSLRIISVGGHRFPDDYRLGFLQARLLEECGEFPCAIQKHLALLQVTQEMPQLPMADVASGQYAQWMALRPEPLAALGGKDSPLAFWLGVKIGYRDDLTSISDRQEGGSWFRKAGQMYLQMHYFIVPPNLESLRASCLARLARMLRELPNSERSRVQVQLNKLAPAQGSYFPMFHSGGFRPDWPSLGNRIRTNPEESARIYSLIARPRLLYSGGRDIELEEPPIPISRPPSELVQQALSHACLSCPAIVLEEHAREWSSAPVSDEALFCLQYLESTEPSADLASELPRAYSDLPVTLPAESLALIPRIDLMLEKWLQTLPNLSPQQRDDLLTCRLECLGKLPDKGLFERLQAQYPRVARHDGERDRFLQDAPPVKLPVPAPSPALQAAEHIVKILLPSNGYRQFDHLMIEANLRLGTPRGSWASFQCQEGDKVAGLLALQHPETALEMGRVAVAYGLIGQKTQARTWFVRALELQPTHRWIRYRAGINFLPSNPTKAEALLGRFPAQAVCDAHVSAAAHYHEPMFLDPAAILMITEAFLRKLPHHGRDYERETLFMFNLINDEPCAAAIPVTDDPSANAKRSLASHSKPSIWSLAGGLTTEQHKKHERLCDQFLAYFRSLPANSIGYEATIWVEIAARVHARRGDVESALADDCVRYLKQYIGANEAAPAGHSLAEAQDFPGPYSIVFEEWMKAPEKLRAKYVSVFNGYPNTNKLPTVLDQMRRLKTCDDKQFPEEVAKYFAAYPEIQTTPKFLLEFVKTRPSFSIYGDMWSRSQDFLHPKSPTKNEPPEQETRVR